MYRSSEEKDLGVTVCDKLHPSVQCAEAANRAMLPLGVVNKCFKHLDQESLPMLYVRLHIETCVQAWSPDYRMNIAWTSSTLIVQSVSRHDLEFFSIYYSTTVKSYITALALNLKL